MKNEVYLKFETDCVNLGGYDPEDSWSRDSYSYSWYFEGFTTNKDSSRYSLPVKDFDPKKELYAVYVVYSTGDSFGHDEDAQLELIYVGHNKELAYKIEKYIEEDNSKNSSSCDIRYNKATIDGVEFYTYPWKGYFESLSYVRVENGYIQ